MITTSNFRRAGKLPTAVSIARGTPRQYRGSTYPPLYPPDDLVRCHRQHRITDDEYVRRYTAEILDRLTPGEVLRDLGPDAVLLCWEGPGEFCHRRLVAAWLQEVAGCEIVELSEDYVPPPEPARP